MVQPASLEDIDWGRTLLQPDVVGGKKVGKEIRVGQSLASDKWIKARGEFDLQMGEQRPEM